MLAWITWYGTLAAHSTGFAGGNVKLMQKGSYQRFKKLIKRAIMAIRKSRTRFKTCGVILLR